MKEKVNHPQHYGGDTTYEVIKVLEAWGLDKSFCLGNVIKYIARAEHKGSALNDLKKAAWYLDRAIKQREIRKGRTWVQAGTGRTTQRMIKIIRKK